jgi:signal transduction histidine kinase
MLAALGALVVVCVLSAATAIIALSFTNRTGRLLQRAGDDLAMIDGLRLALARLAQAGERVLLADDGMVRFRQLTGDVERARQQLRTRGRATVFAVDAEALDRAAGDLQAAIDRATQAVINEPRGAFVAYRDTIKPAREAVDADADRLVHNVIARRDDSSERSASVATRARWALVATAALSIIMCIAFAAGAMRVIARQCERTQVAVAEAKRTAVSQHDLLAASKDLRGPIEVILRAASESMRAPSEHLAQEIYAAAERLRTRVDGLLDMSGINAGTVELRREHCDAAALIDAAVSSVRFLAVERSVRVLVAVPSTIRIHVDRQRIVHVLTTLLGLAVQHAPPGGDVAVTARPSPQGARFAISDGSAPIPHEDAASSRERPSDHYFDQYTMELHVSKRLVEAHGGRLGVDGDAVWLSLPSEPVLLRDPDSRGRAHPNVASSRAGEDQ